MQLAHALGARRAEFARDDALHSGLLCCEYHIALLGYGSASHRTDEYVDVGERGLVFLYAVLELAESDLDPRGAELLSRTLRSRRRTDESCDSLYSRVS